MYAGLASNDDTANGGGDSVNDIGAALFADDDLGYTKVPAGAGVASQMRQKHELQSLRFISRLIVANDDDNDTFGEQECEVENNFVRRIRLPPVMGS